VDDDDDDDVDACVGGVREAFFSNEYYRLVWGKRIGFAKVATEAKVVSCVLYFYLARGFVM